MKRISKSRFMSGEQCLKRLWLEWHEREAPELEVDPAQQLIFDRGHRVGEAARGYVPGGVLIDAPYYAVEQRLADTQDAIASGASVIYEAAFVADDVFVAVDILERTDAGWVLTEVKSTNSVKVQHYPDVAVQLYVLLSGGIYVVRVELMHLNRDCRYPNLDDLFIRRDVTAEAQALLSGIPGKIRDQKIALVRDCPEVEVGGHCHQPYECPFIGRCWPEQPEDHIGSLYNVGPKSEAKLLAQGVETFGDIPETMDLSAIQRRQVEAVRKGELIVDSGIGGAIAGWQPPIGFVDFETVAPAIPCWDGCGPNAPVPVQFSLHVERVGGEVSHEAYLAKGHGDPRPEFAQRLVDACGDVPIFLAFNSSFERSRLEELAKAVPKLKAELDAISGRIQDLLPVVRNHVYHPGFGGSFSLKPVVAALFPKLAYDALEVSDGITASGLIEDLLLREDSRAPDRQESLRQDLLRYCERDTWVMVELLRWLRTQV